MRYFLMIIVAFFLWSVSNTSNAQVSADPKVNLDSQPLWGPAGYDYVEFYYLPDINVYYYVPEHGYYYYTKRQWFYSSTLPPVYSNYDFYNLYKIVMNERAPWRDNETHLKKYSSYKGRHDQELIRDIRDTEYFANKKHPKYNSWLKQQNDNNGDDKSNQQNHNRDN